MPIFGTCVPMENSKPGKAPPLALSRSALTLPPRRFPDLTLLWWWHKSGEAGMVTLSAPNAPWGVSNWGPCLPIGVDQSPSLGRSPSAPVLLCPACG